MSFLAKGQQGTLRVAGRDAAVFRDWTFTPAPERGGPWRVTASLVEADDYWLDSGSPVELRLALSHSRWRWRDVTFTRAGSGLTITGTGAPQEL